MIHIESPAPWFAKVVYRRLFCELHYWSVAVTRRGAQLDIHSPAILTCVCPASAPVHWQTPPALSLHLCVKVSIMPSSLLMALLPSLPPRSPSIQLDPVSMEMGFCHVFAYHAWRLLSVWREGKALRRPPRVSRPLLPALASSGANSLLPADVPAVLVRSLSQDPSSGCPLASSYNPMWLSLLSSFMHTLSYQPITAALPEPPC